MNGVRYRMSDIVGRVYTNKCGHATINIVAFGPGEGSIVEPWVRKLGLTPTVGHFLTEEEVIEEVRRHLKRIGKQARRRAWGRFGRPAEVEVVPWEA